jgi:hypothetical protein
MPPKKIQELLDKISKDKILDTLVYCICDDQMPKVHTKPFEFLLLN